MSIFHTETEADAQARARHFDRAQSKKRGTMRRLIYQAKAAGRTVPFSIRDMIELGCSASTIRRVYRNPS